MAITNSIEAKVLEAFETRLMAGSTEDGVQKLRDLATRIEQAATVLSNQDEEQFSDAAFTALSTQLGF
jgi:predicted component of type VI protein secretion system